jgi:hypothetical protein
MKLPAQRIKGGSVNLGCRGFQSFPSADQGGIWVQLIAFGSFLLEAPFVAGEEAVLPEAEIKRARSELFTTMLIYIPHMLYHFNYRLCICPFIKIQ